MARTKQAKRVGNPIKAFFLRNRLNKLFQASKLPKTFSSPLRWKKEHHAFKQGECNGNLLKGQTDTFHHRPSSPRSVERHVSLGFLWLFASSLDLSHLSGFSWSLLFLQDAYIYPWRWENQVTMQSILPYGYDEELWIYTWHYIVVTREVYMFFFFFFDGKGGSKVYVNLTLWNHC